MASYTKAAQVSAVPFPSGQAVPGRPLPPTVRGGLTPATAAAQRAAGRERAGGRWDEGAAGPQGRAGAAGRPPSSRSALGAAVRSGVRPEGLSGGNRQRSVGVRLPGRDGAACCGRVGLFVVIKLCLGELRWKQVLGTK